MAANDGSDSAFTDSGHAFLSLIHLFRATADVGALLSLDPQRRGAGRAVSAAERDDRTRLLDAAADRGLLIRFQDGYYGLLPGQRDYFSTLFERFVTSLSNDNRDAAEAVYANIFAERGRYYDQEIRTGDGQAALHGLRRDEENLLHALSLAREQRDRRAAAGCMRGLYQLYRVTGQDLQWAHITSMHRDHIDPATGQPNPARIDDHRLIIACYMDLAEACLAEGDPAWLDRYVEAFDLSGLIGDVAQQADVANCIGNVYMTDPRERDLDRSQAWIMRAFELIPATDEAKRALSFGFMGNIAFDRFIAAKQQHAGQERTGPERTGQEPSGHRRVSQDRIRQLFDQAVDSYQRALTMLPAGDHRNRAFFHTECGNLISQIGEWDMALAHHRLAIDHFEALGDLDGAGRARLNVAQTLIQSGRAPEARQAACAARDNFAAAGPRAQARLAEAAELIRRLS